MVGIRESSSRCRMCARKRRVVRHHVKVFPIPRRPFVTRQELGIGILLASFVWILLAPLVVIIFLP